MDQRFKFCADMTTFPLFSREAKYLAVLVWKLWLIPSLEMKTDTHTVKVIYLHTLMDTFPPCRPTATLHWLYYRVDIFNQLKLWWDVMTVLNVTNFSFYVFCLSHLVFLICTFPFSPIPHPSSHGCNVLVPIATLHCLLCRLSVFSSSLRTAALTLSVAPRFMLLALVTAWLSPRPLITCPPLL